MRRKSGQSDLRQRAIEQYRKTHEKMMHDHQDLLLSIRARLKGIEMPEAVVSEHAIDRKKNIRTVSKLFELKNHSPEFQSRLKEILLSQQA